MNSVDTGWVTDEDPAEIAARKVAEHRFHPPLDIVDGAARIVDPDHRRHQHRRARLGQVPEGLPADGLVGGASMARRALLITLLTTLAATLSAWPARADAGLPMLVLMWPAFGVLFVPIVCVEAFVAMRQLGATWRQSLMASLLANIISTAVGIPATWGALVLVEMGGVAAGGWRAGIGSLGGRVLAVTVEAPWLYPYEDDLWWMVPIAAAVLLVPFFFVSVGLESLIFKRWMKVDWATARRWSWRANLITYGFMMLGAIGWGFWSGASPH